MPRCERISKASNLDAAEMRKIFPQILYAVEFLHANGISHCDIKPNNIMKRGDNYVLIDFDRSTICNTCEYIDSAMYVRPPEAIGKRSNFAAAPIDCWGVGVTMLCLMD